MIDDERTRRPCYRSPATTIVVAEGEDDDDDDDDIYDEGGAHYGAYEVDLAAVTYRSCCLDDLEAEAEADLLDDLYDEVEGQDGSPPPTSSAPQGAGAAAAAAADA